MKSRSFLCISFCLLFSLSLPSVAKAKPRADASVLSIVLEGMDRSRRLQFCGYVAKEAANQAGEASDVALRSRRYAAAQALQSRVVSSLAKAGAHPTPEEAEESESENSQALGLLSYAPSPQLAAQIQQGEENDIVGLFLSDVVAHCDVLLNSMGVAAAVPIAPDSLLVPISFKWRGKTAQEAFEGTGLAPYASKICVGAESKVGDFAGAIFSDRGKDGISLLDWAFECRDKSAFKALLNSGFDATKPGQFNDLPLLYAVETDDTWYLSELLAHGAPPNSMGRFWTALSAAYDPMKEGGGESFRLLRAAGASLNFGDPGRSMWSTWADQANWELILANWSEFEGDPVALGRNVSWELDNPPPRGNKRALEELKSRLIADYGVCFPVEMRKDMARDDRGHFVQAGCPKRDR